MNLKDTTPNARKAEVKAYKKQKILSAAAILFRINGLEGTTMRSIASAAGYSTGAPYAYFQSKEEIYAELLFMSLGNLTKSVKNSAKTTDQPTDIIKKTFRAYFEYYNDHPEDMQLGLYLFSSGEVKKQGFSADTNKLLNGRLMALLGYMANILLEYAHISAQTAQTETLDATSYFTGTLMLQETGRLSLFGAKSQEMIDRYIQTMLKRLGT